MKHIPNSIPWAAAFIVALGLSSCQKEDPISPTVASNGIVALAKKEGKGMPTVPANLQVPAGQELALHVSAIGVQIYTCKASTTDPPTYSWVFKAPEATLYEAEDKEEANELEQVGRHYAGPTWESNKGSKVVGSVLQRAPSPAPNSIPWLLLQAVSNSGHGVFSKVTYIQRVNTSGGVAPSTGADADHLGQEVRVPYTADYYFYKADD